MENMPMAMLITAIKLAALSALAMVLILLAVKRGPVVRAQGQGCPACVQLSNGQSTYYGCADSGGFVLWCEPADNGSGCFVGGYCYTE